MGIVVSVCLFVSIPFCCLCMCMCTYYFVSMYMKIMGIRLCVYIKHVSKPPHGVQWEWLACYCFYGAVWTIVLYCVMFLSLQNIQRGVALVCLLYVCERNFMQ